MSNECCCHDGDQHSQQPWMSVSVQNINLIIWFFKWFGGTDIIGLRLPVADHCCCLRKNVAKNLFNASCVQIAPNPTLHLPGTLRMHMPSMKSIRWMVCKICVRQTGRQKFVKLVCNLEQDRPNSRANCWPLFCTKLIQAKPLPQQNIISSDGGAITCMQCHPFGRLLSTMNRVFLVPVYPEIDVTKDKAAVITFWSQTSWKDHDSTCVLQ